MYLVHATIQVRNSPVHYGVAGQGEPVVLIHGLSESTAVWRHNVAALAERYTVYALDLPGFGAMRRFHQQFHLQESSSWLACWMEAVGLEAAHLIGHSMGGYPCIALAASHPEKVKSLVLVASIGVPFGELEKRRVYRALKSVVRTIPTFWPCIVGDYLRAGPILVARAIQQIDRLDAASALAAITAPTLLVWGEYDDLIPLSMGYQLQARLAGSRLHIIPRTNHFCMFEQPEDFHDALFSFLQTEEIV